jgi:hypothetical protein
MSSRSIRKQRHLTDTPTPKIKDRVVAGKDGLHLIDVWKASLPERKLVSRAESSTNEDGECFDGVLEHKLTDILAMKDVSFKPFRLPPVYATPKEGKTARSRWYLDQEDAFEHDTAYESSLANESTG